MSKNKNQSNSAETSKIHDNTNTEYTGDTGGTGGIGFAPESSVGDTGGPGGIPEYAYTIDTDHNNSYKNYPEAAVFTGGTGGVDSPYTDPSLMNDQDIEEFAKKNFRSVLHGSTGGQGGVPENIEELDGVENVENRMVNVSEKELEGVSDEELHNLFRDDYHAILQSERLFNSFSVPRALRLGQVINIWKNRHGKNGNWSEWLKENVVEKYDISHRTCQMYMAIANTPGAGLHPEYGVADLAAVGVAYSKLPYEEQKNVGDDAVEYFLGKWKKEKSFRKRRDYLRADLKQRHLNRMKIYLPLELVYEFLSGGHTFSKDLNKYLKTLTGEDEATRFIEMVKDGEGTWKDYLPKDAAGAEESKSNAGSSDSAAKKALSAVGEVRTPRLKEQTVTLRDSIKSVIDSGSYEGEVTPEDIDALISDLLEYKKNVVAAKAVKSSDEGEAV